MKTRQFVGTCFVLLVVLSFAVIPLMLVSTAHAAGPVIEFVEATPPSYTVNPTPYGVATGDFNRDGYPDVVVTSHGGTTASVLINRGAGVFTPGYICTVGTAPWGVAVGDFNVDGYDDFAVANEDSDNVSVCLNNRDGTFAPAANYTVGDGPRGIAAGDFDNDGLIDLVVANAAESSVSVLIDDPAGVFTASQPVAVDPNVSPTGIVLGDFDGDGLLDVATANPVGTNGSVSILVRDDQGGLSLQPSVTTDKGTISITAGDFNDDGDLDLATANTLPSSFPLDGSINILLGDGTGFFSNFTTIADYQASVRGITSADFNLDGLLDLAIVFDGDKFGLLAGNGDGNFVKAPESVPEVETGLTPWAVATADFDDDGKPDLVTADSGGNTVSILLNTTNVPVASLQIRKFAAQSIIPSGGAITYTLRYVNAGSVSALGVVLADVIPVTVTDPLIVTSSRTITPVPGSRYIWNLGTLTGTSRGFITVTGVLSGGLAPGSLIANTAEISTTSYESVTTDNQSTAIVSIACPKIYTVENTNDSGDKSLRQGLAYVCRGGTIVFSQAILPATVNILSQLEIAKDLTILGPGAISVTVRPQVDGRVFYVDPIAHASIYGITIRDGLVTSSTISAASISNPGIGAGIYNDGNLKLIDTDVTSNTAESGGGIFNAGSLQIRGTDLTQNLATSPNGLNGGGHWPTLARSKSSPAPSAITLPKSFRT